MELKRVEEVYEQLGKFTVDLPPDGWSLGPKYIHDMISLTRGYINSVSFILQEILQERQNLDRAKHAAQAMFDLESSRLLAEDDRVRRMPNIEDRKGQLNLILRERVLEIQGLEGQLLDLSYVEKAVKHRHNELKATMSDIRAQRALIRDAIDSGSYYGDESGTSRGSTTSPRNGVSSNFSEADLDRDMAELDAMLASGVTPSETVTDPSPLPPEESPATIVEEPIVATPAVVVETSPAPMEDDFSDLISGVEDSPAVPTVSVPTPQTTVEDPDLARFLDGEDLFDEALQSV